MATSFAEWEDDGGSVWEPHYTDVVFDQLTGRYTASVEVDGVVYASLGFETAEQAYDEALEMRWFYSDWSAN